MDRYTLGKIVKFFFHWHYDVQVSGEELLRDGRSEPRLALDGDVTITGDKSDSDDGLEIIRNLMPQLGEHVAPGGFFLMETGEYNADSAAAFLRANGYVDVNIELDLEGQKRVVCARLN